MQQQRFLHRVRSALGHPADVRRPSDTLSAPSPSKRGEALAAFARQRTRAQRLALIPRLKAAGEALNLKVCALPDPEAAATAVADLVATKETEWGGPKRLAAWDHPLLRRMALEKHLATLTVPIFYTAGDDDIDHEQIRQGVTGAFVGITSADYCLADTGTLVMCTRPGEARMVSLVPSIHVAVVELEQIILDLKELYALLNHPPSSRPREIPNAMTLITGPSKTADIEATMVQGAHGPREVHILIITGESL